MDEQKIRILIVDDHEMVRKGLRILLENFDDFEVIGEANSARKGIDLCRRVMPDVVLMDIVMPEISGVEATRAIRQAFPQVQVIALTSFSDDSTVQEALNAGAVGYLLKNVSIDELATAVRRARQGQSTLAPEAAQVLIRAATQPRPLGFDLTEREREVLALLIEGLNNRQIAERLVISASTVKNHVSSILEKLGASSRTQAVALAVEHQLLSA